MIGFWLFANNRRQFLLHNWSINLIFLEVVGVDKNICSFRLGISDAGFLTKQFQPEFGERDLLNLGTGEIYLKTMVNGTPKDPFSVKVAAIEKKKPGNPKMAEMIKRLSALKYGRPKAIVEAEIAQRARL